MAAENQDTVYNSNSLSKWFAISSLILLLIVVWALLEDYDRPWKGYQRQAKRIAAAVGESRLKRAQGAVDKSKLNGLELELKSIQTEETALVGEIDAKIKSLNDDYLNKNRKFQDLKGELSADLFQLEKEIEHEGPNARKMKADYDVKAKKVEQLQVLADAAEAKFNKAKDMRVDILSAGTKIAERKDRVLKEVGLLRKQVSDNEADIGNIVRNAPLVDFVAPTIKINQIILPDLKDDYFFNKVGRVDRCMTCHVTVDKAGFEDYPEPFTTHPKLKLMVGADSPHPASKVGCTTCHSGVPQSVDFAKTAHVPRDLAQEEEWRVKYHFHRDHQVKTQMIPLGMTEGKCIQCHATQVQLDGAPTFNAGMRLIERYGCYNCHKFAGHFEQLAKEKKSGPQLTNIAAKVTPEWAKKWIWDPKSYRPTTLMPNFWLNHNNSDPASIERGKVEVDGIIHYLFKRSEPFEPIKMASTAVADANHGKELVGTIGCLGCHAVNDFPRVNPKSANDPGWKNPIVPLPGPELNQLGSKVTKEWLFSWMTNPKHYWGQTSMPSLKLSEADAKDITEYLLTKKNEAFEALPVPVASDAVRDSVVTDYLRKTMAPKEASIKLASMSLEDRQDFVGQKLITHYGCYACHAIKGFEDAPNVGAELTYEGSKDVTKFSFENAHLDHTSRPDWIFTKIKSPRIWDVGKVRDFEAKTKMPDFKMSHEQATTVAAIVIGYENKNVDETAVQKMDGRWEQIVAGQRIMNRYNCVGCHAIDNKQGHIRAFYADDLNNAPPALNKEGARVQPDWLHQYLLNPDVKIRPWLSLRMPNFKMTNEEVTTMTKYFAAYDKAPYPYIAHTNKVLTAEEVKAAEALITQLGCMSCHATNVDLAGSAPHFPNEKVRLRPDWVASWIANPISYLPYTRMPQLWQPENPDDPKSAYAGVPGILDGKGDTQIQKVRDYLYQYPGAFELPSAPTHDPDVPHPIIR